MKTKEKNIIVGYKIGDLVGGLLSLSLSLFLLFQMDNTEKWTAFLMASFLGIAGIFILWKFVNPKNKFVGKNSAEAKVIREKEFKHLQSTNGPFNYNEKGFELTLNGKLTKTNWNEINRISAYKVDLLSVDEICIFVDIDEKRSFEISENTKGWFVFGKKIREIFPEIKETWEFDVAIPPFERNETELYNRNKNIE